MTIYSALYYPGSLSNGDLIIRDNRYYPGKYAETFPVWLQYVRKHYPNEQIVLFVDESSPIPWDKLAFDLGEPYTLNGDSWSAATQGANERLHIRFLNQFAGDYFRPMQRNLVEGMCHAYVHNQDFFWLDNDAFLNSDICPLIKNIDFSAPDLAHHQMTAGSVCTFISSKRLHAYDRFCRLPDYLRRMVNEGPVETRMHSLQEGGLYKMFCFGKTVDLVNRVNLSHLSCYKHFMQFLRHNPLNTPDYRSLVSQLENLDMSRLNGVEMEFWDMYYEEGKSNV